MDERIKIPAVPLRVGPGRSEVRWAGHPKTCPHGQGEPIGWLTDVMVRSVPFLGLARACWHSGHILAKCSNVWGGFCVWDVGSGIQHRVLTDPILYNNTELHHCPRCWFTCAFHLKKKKKRKIFMLLHSPSPNKKSPSAELLKITLSCAVGGEEVPTSQARPRVGPACGETAQIQSDVSRICVLALNLC